MLGKTRGFDNDERSLVAKPQRNKRQVGPLRINLYFSQLQPLPTTLLHLTFHTDQIISQTQPILLPYQLAQHHLHLRPGQHRHVLLFQELAEQVVGAFQGQGLSKDRAQSGQQIPGGSEHHLKSSGSALRQVQMLDLGV